MAGFYQGVVGPGEGAALIPGLHSIRRHVGVGDEANVICKSAKVKGLDQIVRGTRGLGSVSNLLLGSMATKVIHLSPVLWVK